jgi:hypothetical protein
MISSVALLTLSRPYLYCSLANIFFYRRLDQTFTGDFSFVRLKLTQILGLVEQRGHFIDGGGCRVQHFDKSVLSLRIVS